MRKKVIAFASVVVLVAAMVTMLTAFASNPAAEESVQPASEAAAPVTQPLPMEQVADTGAAGSFDIFSLMFDENGEPVSEDVLEVNLDKAVEDGYLSAEDKEFLLAMFSYCVAGGADAGAGFPCGPGGAGFGGCPLSGGS